MAINNYVSNKFYLRLSIVLTFTIATYPVWGLEVEYLISVSIYF